MRKRERERDERVRERERERERGGRERERERGIEKEQDEHFLKLRVSSFMWRDSRLLDGRNTLCFLKLLFENNSLKSHNKFVVLEHIILIDDPTYILPHQNHTFCRNCYMRT